MRTTDDTAVVGMPIYLTVVIVVAAAVIALFAVSLYHIIMDAQINQVAIEVNRIASEAENMFEYADEGTNVTVHVEFPGTMRYLVFGGLPTNGNNEPPLTLDENTSNNYFFVMSDGTSKIFHSPARFSSENTNQIALFHPGSYDVTLELINTGGKTYVTISY